MVCPSAFFFLFLFCFHFCFVFCFRQLVYLRRRVVRAAAAAKTFLDF
jgi:hypothetical protein